MTKDLKKYFKEIEKRYSELKNACDKDSFIQSLVTISLWNKEPMDYPDTTGAKFPDSIHIAHAVCHPECGVQEFIVDGSTQKCQQCGGMMFINEVREYKIKQ